MGLGKTLEHMRQDAFAVIVRRTQPHHAGNVGDNEFRDRLAVDRQQTPGVTEQHFAVRGQRHRARVAREHRAAENVFQFLDLHRDSRRRPINRIGGGGEAAGLGDRHEGAQNVEIEDRQRMIEGSIHDRVPSIFLIENIISFRLIEHLIAPIVNMEASSFDQPEQGSGDK